MHVVANLLIDKDGRPRMSSLVHAKQRKDELHRGRRPKRGGRRVVFVGSSVGCLNQAT
jgi:hypothetical protein